MQKRISIVNVLSAEFYKTKRSLAKRLLLLFPFAFTLFTYIYYYFKAGSMSGNLWLKAGGQVIFPLYSFFYPLIVAFVAFSFYNIEYKNLGIKHLLTLPVSKLYIYIAKLLVLCFFVTLSLVIAYVSFKLGGNILGTQRPELGFQNYDSDAIINLFFIKTFIALICIAVLQYILSMAFPNFLISLGVAAFLTILSIIVNSWEYAFLIPYRNIYSALQDLSYEDIELMRKEIVVAYVYIPVFIILGGLIFNKKR